MISANSSSQKGATLVVVLVLLLLITIIGVYAMRQSLTNLGIATNVQIQKLLMQSSDVALRSIEKNFTANEASNFAGTPVGQSLLTGNEGLELQFCYKPSELDSSNALTNNYFFNLKDFRMVSRVSTTASGVSLESGDVTKGICNASTMFATGRKAVVTQIGVIQPDDPAEQQKKYDLSVKNTDLKNADIEVKRVRVIAVSLAPAMAINTSITDINNCLSGYVMDEVALRNQASDSTATPTNPKATTVQQCLNSLGVPVNTQVTEYIINLPQTRTELTSS